MVKKGNVAVQRESSVILSIKEYICIILYPLPPDLYTPVNLN